MLAPAIANLTTLLTLCGLAFSALALWSARSFYRSLLRWPTASALPPVSILKPVKGADAGLYEALATHCRLEYAAPFEILCGLAALDDPAAGVIARLQAEFPGVDLRVVPCPLSLGANGKVSNLVQLLPHARYDRIVISDSDIAVGPRYLERIVAGFEQPGSRPVGMVTAPYRGRSTGVSAGSGTLGSKLEALGIATDFFPGVLTARFLERGVRFGLGSTLAVTREALERAGGLLPLVDQLADDYQMGARIAGAGFRVVLAGEVVSTEVPAYTMEAFWAHQLRWARTVRDSRRGGYLGLALTYVLPWALVNVVANGADLPSLALLAVAVFVRAMVALTVGAGLLGDRQVIRDLWLLPLRDALGLALWVWSFAEDVVVWRGERFRLRRGTLVVEGPRRGGL